MAERLIQKEQAHGLCQGTVEMGLGPISSPQLVILGGKGAFAQLSNCTSANQGLGAFSLPLVRKVWRSRRGAQSRSTTTLFLLGKVTVIFVLLRDRFF